MQPQNVAPDTWKHSRIGDVTLSFTLPFSPEASHKIHIQEVSCLFSEEKNQWHRDAKNNLKQKALLNYNPSLLSLDHPPLSSSYISSQLLYPYSFKLCWFYCWNHIHTYIPLPFAWVQVLLSPAPLQVLIILYLDWFLFPTHCLTELSQRFSQWPDQETPAFKSHLVYSYFLELLNLCLWGPSYLWFLSIKTTPMYFTNPFH